METERTDGGATELLRVPERREYSLLQWIIRSIKNMNATQAESRFFIKWAVLLELFSFFFFIIISSIDCIRNVSNNHWSSSESPERCCWFYINISQVNNPNYWYFAVMFSISPKTSRGRRPFSLFYFEIIEPWMLCPKASKKMTFSKEYKKHMLIQLY